MQYEILSHTNKSQLETIVRSYLESGWRCQGGVAVAVNPKDGDLFFLQAITKD